MPRWPMAPGAIGAPDHAWVVGRADWHDRPVYVCLSCGIARMARGKPGRHGCVPDPALVERHVRAFRPSSWAATPTRHPWGRPTRKELAEVLGILAVHAGEDGGPVRAMRRLVNELLALRGR